MSGHPYAPMMPDAQNVRTTQEPALPTGPLDARLRGVHSALGDLVDWLEVLEQRLAPFLLPPVPADPHDALPEPMMSDLGVQLQTITANIRRRGEHVQSLLDRLDA